VSEAPAAPVRAAARPTSSGELLDVPLELAHRFFVWTANADGSLRSISPQYRELTGLGPHQHPAEAIHPEDREIVLSAWRANVRRETVHLVDYRLRLASGEYRRFRSQAAPRRDSRGRIARWYGTIEDVHHQAEAEQALAAAEERFRLAARATNDAIWDVDLVSGQIDWADTSNALFGYLSGSRATDMAWWELHLHPDERDEVVRSRDAAIASKDSHWAAEYRFRRADGSYADVLDRGFILRDEDGRAVRIVGAMSDVSELRRSEAEVQRMQNELIHVSRLSAMGEMASTLAHELNQPLTAISSYLRGTRTLLRDVRSEPVERVAPALEAAEVAALRAGQIVRRLREFVARGSASVKREDLNELIADACMLAMVDAELLGIDYRIDTDLEARWVMADRIQIQQVLINLLRNAVQAMGGSDLRELRIATAVRNGMTEVTVTDTGIGIPDALKETLFSPFQSTKPDGLGIGLSISRTIVEAHGGKIRGENRRGRGARFRFSLPRAEPPRAAE
jgi:two-component system, LuxR family, sensor kinase FixL